MIEKINRKAEKKAARIAKAKAIAEENKFWEELEVEREDFKQKGLKAY